MKYSQIKSYEFSIDGIAFSRQQKDKKMGEVGGEVDRKTKEYMADYPKISYSAAMHAVLDADKKLKEEYAR